MNIQGISIGNLTINQRLFVLIILFIGLPFFLLGSFWYQSSTEAIEQFAAGANKRIIEQTNVSLDSYISNLENSTYPFIHNPQIQQFLSTSQLTPYSYFQLATKVENDLFAQMIYGRSDIIGISLVADNKRQITDYESAPGLLDMSEIRKRNLSFQAQLDQFSDFQIIGLSRVGKTPALTVARKLYDNSSFLYKGLLIVDLNLKQIGAICSNDSLGGFDVWIMGRGGQVIYHPDSNLVGSIVEQGLFARIQNQNSSFFRHQDAASSTEKMVLHERSQITGWTVVADLPLNNLIGGLITQRNYSLAAAAMLMIIALALVGGFSLSLTRPLSMLQKLMARVERGDFVLPTKMNRFRNHEMTAVFQSFYSMTGELKRLIREVHDSRLKERELMIRQKESELRSMQSHINPHFLYNSLEIINSYAIADDHMDISRMTRALAHMFRYNIGHAGSVVPLREEMRHVQFYLDLQSARFRKLQIDIDVDEHDLDRVKAVRLTLQPIIENVFIHGYRGKKPRYLGISTRAEGHYFAVVIQDKGIGMNSEKKRHIRGILQTPENPEDELRSNEGEEPTSGIGLLNVHQRLQLTFGAEYGLHLVQSVPDEGTQFEVRLPYMTSEEAHHVPVNDD
ncbi:two-component system sensor histidine kinase YesM [Paenibacillus sp. LBL]|uniref:sensor histidine kinase n=1 Tax=Paenibacillus TaxID=44249 RepID=UPI00128CD41C|nr:MULTISPECIES: histidine kinase [Paenibacillus]MDH6672611.1 two-component system sensor histidine kinase YesM [Paenibacillus sp. LBL]MPY18990.1 sensor histidine kinase [Paenibacillus glucanolyticus]